MRWLITGAGGQVGRACCRRAAEVGIETVAFEHGTLDLCDEEGVARALDEAAADIVINAAAYTAVDHAETLPETAAAINAAAPGRLAVLCHERRLPLVHFSTNYVFDGTKGSAYKEDDCLGPLSVYGASKAAGETAIRAVLPRHIILRTSWVFSPWGRNFVTTMLGLAQEHASLRIVADQRGGPTSAAYLASAVERIAMQLREGGDLPWGTYHIAGAPPVSWYDFAAALFEIWADLTGAAAPVLTAISTADYPTPARRPTNAVLDTRRLFSAFGIAPGDWQRDLRAVLREIAKESDR